MEELERLKRLLEHWIEHNREHARNYMDWAKRIEDLNPLSGDLSRILKDLSSETERLEGLLKKALEELERLAQK